jgi:short-subunit dehydrogenase
MKPMDFRGRWVVVTGASAGLGREMARRLANDHGANLVIAARRQDKLEELAQELRASARVDVLPVAADLSRLDDVDRLYETATAGRDVYGVILNAGVTHFGQHHELEWDAFERMLDTNVRSVVRLTTRFVPHLERLDQGGGIMLVSSMAGTTPTAYQTAYSATKAFLVNYGCCLYHETEGKNLSITTFVPGGIVTDMTSGERVNTLRTWLMPVPRCAREGVEAFRLRRYLHVPGVVYRVGFVVSRLLPHRFVTGRVAATYRKALQVAARNGDGV